MTRPRNCWPRRPCKLPSRPVQARFWRTTSTPGPSAGPPATSRSKATDGPAGPALRRLPLISAANPDDERVSIGARALTGDAYLGHVFWDTEIFLLPFYTLTWPAAARALLMYRYHTLPAARAKAARLGYRGALYAWESADTGDEATPPSCIGPDGRGRSPIRCGTEEQHISADVAYAVWQYWQATGDDAVPARRRRRDPAGDRALLGAAAPTWRPTAATTSADVIGPDEYHEGVDDNAYTNVHGAAGTSSAALEVAALLRARWPERWATLRERLGLAPDGARATGATSPRGWSTGLDPASG